MTDNDFIGYVERRMVERQGFEKAQINRLLKLAGHPLLASDSYPTGGNYIPLANDTTVTLREEFGRSLIEQARERITKRAGRPVATESDFKFDLGDEVEDTVSGFEGVVVGRHQWLTGRSTYTVQSRASFDEPHLRLVKAASKAAKGA